MSKDETGKTEGQGLPGYSANNSIPNGFALPIPTATAAGEVDEPETSADPWSSTWDDSSGQPGQNGSSETRVNDWSDSFEYDGEYTAEYESAYNGSRSGQNGGSSWEPREAGTRSHDDARPLHGPRASTTVEHAITSRSRTTPVNRLPSLRRPVTRPCRTVTPMPSAARVSASTSL